jgi:hypothetical protein
MTTNKILLVALLAMPLQQYAQTVVDKSISVQGGQKVVMHFDYPELIQITTWDKNEISIKGSVSINGGENDDAFEIFSATNGNTISIRNEIKDFKNLPHRITIVDGAKTILLKDKEELRKYQAEHGRGEFERMSWGVDMDIQMKIKIPRNMDTRVESVYGMVEVQDFLGPLTVVATYGGVDVSLLERATGEITAETNYGEIYSNLETRFDGDSHKNEAFHIFVQAKPGNGPRYSLDSKYGNVYLRKAN